MTIGVICCRVLEREVRTVIADLPDVTHLEIMDWGLHVRPDRLRNNLSERIRNLQDRVDAVVLGYGRCQTLDKLSNEFSIPLFYPPAEDCIGVLLGQERYEKELAREPGTWFLTPGWTKLGLDFVFHELQVQHMAEKGIDPMRLARRMLNGFSRVLLIDWGLNDGTKLYQEAGAIAAELQLRLEKTEGSLAGLRETFQQALDNIPRPIRSIKSKKAQT
jgi:hypothetical protein